MSNERASSKFDYVMHWPQGTPKDSAAVLEFWRCENAVADEAQAQQRLREVVLHARNEAGDVVGVCTAVPIAVSQLRQPMYYYRCFIGSDWRTTRLVLSLLKRAFAVLEEYGRDHNFPCIGVILELENAHFEKALRVPIWPSTGFTYVGKSRRNLDLRVRYFRGARLKSVSTS